MAGGRPSYQANGGSNFRTKKYPAITSGVMYVGDAVKVSSGVVKPLAHAATALASAACLGFVSHFVDSNERPPTFALPNGNIGKPAGSAGWFAFVYDDPDIVFEIETNGTASAGLIGGVHSIVSATPTTALGQSGHQLADTAASAGDGQFAVLGVRQDVSGANAANSHALVMIKRHTYRNGI